MPTRQEHRAETTERILAAARAELARVGAAALSLRAVTREVGMVSSAVYRYFPSRDELLTALIIEAYDAVGEAAESADHDGPALERWVSVWRAVRRWAGEHPAQYALIYGSPVPGYAAPPDTLPAAGRVGAVLVRIAAGHGTVPDPGPVVRNALAVDLLPDLTAELAPAAIAAWTQLFGTVGFELFGQYDNVVLDRDAFFDHVARTTGAACGIG
ncbi:TetR/AcrR family transcriptional regulator [Actinomycetospora soli]|uniref:TetR/AcrR family transcriptional regulator n=1 Tax=Actinomycetospora soli TaxID=2893887 RepID=UPI001E4BFAA7|nr:TetR/AcrR family transcriptional regulator [Actinomycetospora soli]MCD2189610.1 TetR/AcrR family transcriptional regulator [Actinomycetospora soli]